MKLSDTLSGLGRTVAYYPGLAKLIGVKECVLLCQFIYWHDKSHTADGWVYKTRDEIEDETGLSHEEQTTARKKLKALGLWEEENKRMEHKMLYRVNLEALNALWEEAQSARLRETVDHGVGKPETTVSLYKDTRVPQDAGANAMPKQLLTHDFPTAWEEWIRHLRDRGKPMGDVQRDAVWRDCITAGAEQAVRVIRACLRAGYKKLCWDVKLEPLPKSQVRVTETDEDRLLREAKERGDIP
jgi:hypothetical protein